MRDIAAEVDAAGFFRLFPTVFKAGVENQLGVAGEDVYKRQTFTRRFTTSRIPGKLP